MAFKGAGTLNYRKDLRRKDRDWEHSKDHAKRIIAKRKSNLRRVGKIGGMLMTSVNRGGKIATSEGTPGYGGVGMDLAALSSGCRILAKRPKGGTG